MNMQNSILSFIGFWLISLNVTAQLQTGTWRDHLPYNTAHTVAIGDNKVYCAAEDVMFYYDLNDKSVNRMSKTSGLSDIGIGSIAYNDTYKCLVVGYVNGNIDVFKDKKYNMSDLKEKNLLADKNINHINFYNDKAYLSCGFGIVVINIDKLEFVDTYFFNSGDGYTEIQASIIFQDTIYALTSNGVLKASINSNFLSFHESWEQDTTVFNPNSDFYSATIFNGKLHFANSYTSINEQAVETTTYVIQTFDGKQWRILADTLSLVKSITSSDDELIVVDRWHTDLYDADFKLVGHYESIYGQHALKGDDDFVYIADKKEGLLVRHNNIYTEPVVPDGPATDMVFKMGYLNNEILVAPGGYTSFGTSQFMAGDIYSFNDNVWRTYTASNSPLLTDVRDIIDFATQKGNSKQYYAVSYGFGMVEITDDQVTNVYTPENTNNALSNLIGGATFDNDGNLWMVCSNSSSPFVVKTPDNHWYTYAYDNQWSNLLANKVIQVKNGDFWTISNRGEGFFVWDANNTPEIGSDDTFKKYRLLNDDLYLIDDVLNEIVEDLDGDIWIGTSNGVAIISNPEQAIDDDYVYAYIPQVAIDGYNNSLLEGESVTSIAVDGANRKWIGTAGGGLFLISSDGTKQILIFNESNSPLLSNNIVSLEINQSTGELFIGTDKGIIAYMTTASESKESYSNIFCFPNPVKGDYQDIITIRGLLYESNVKITDLSGQLVFETNSNGGTAIWNGRDLQGNLVSSGIYTVMCTTSDGQEGGVAKILVVR